MGFLPLRGLGASWICCASNPSLNSTRRDLRQRSLSLNDFWRENELLRTLAWPECFQKQNKKGIAKCNLSVSQGKDALYFISYHHAREGFVHGKFDIYGG